MLDPHSVDPEAFKDLPLEHLRLMTADVLAAQEQDRQETQLLYYQVSQPRALEIHRSHASIIGVGGGNRSSKTDTVLAEIISLATGVFPLAFRDEFAAKFRGPIRVRICIESLKTVLHPILLPKLKWWSWNGIDEPGGPRGHWGWVSKMSLKEGSWDRSWSEKLTTLTVICRDPNNHERILGESLIQVMSYDQSPEDFASGSFHIVQMDEPPPFAIWRENQARVLDVNGRIYITMTWPDDPSIPVDWIYDHVYEKGQPGLARAPNVDWIELSTLDNVNLDTQNILKETAHWDDQTKKVRLEGQPLRFSNRIHPLFTDLSSTWCFTCHKSCLPMGRSCGCERGSLDIAHYCHVEDFEHREFWPVIQLLDPHPRKPHMMLWVAIDPADDLHVIAEANVEGDAVQVRERAQDIEETYKLDVRLRLMDPNMGKSPSGVRREVNWQDEFNAAGLPCDLANDSDVGRKRLDTYLKPDEKTLRPRIVIHPRCTTAIQQLKRYAWDEYRHSVDRDLKQQPKDKYSDMPTLLKYLMNYDPSFQILHAGAPIIRRPGTRKGPY